MIGSDEQVTFAAYVHDLWCQAGAPSARRLARAAGVSPQTANELVRRGVAAKWATVQPLLEFLGADLDLASALWAEKKHLSTRREPRPESVPVTARLAQLEAAVRLVSERLDEVLRRLPGP